MKDSLSKLQKEVQAALESMHIEVTDICIRDEKKYKFLTIELDKIGGIDLDTIVEATNIINTIVDKYDFNKFMPKTDIRIAELFNDAGIVGAAMAAKNRK